MMILKVTSFVEGHKMDVNMISKITHLLWISLST
jgi:hypothetical protein